MLVLRPLMLFCWISTQSLPASSVGLCSSVTFSERPSPTTPAKNSAHAIHLGSGLLYMYFLSCLLSSHVVYLFACLSLEGSSVSTGMKVSSPCYLQCPEESQTWKRNTINIFWRNEYWRRNVEICVSNMQVYIGTCLLSYLQATTFSAGQGWLCFSRSSEEGGRRVNFLQGLVVPALNSC